MASPAFPKSRPTVQHGSHLSSFPKQNVIRLKGKALERLRRACYERDERCCRECGVPLIWESGYLNSMHMAHIIPKAKGGDVLDNVRTLCPKHHAIEHSNGTGLAAMHF